MNSSSSRSSINNLSSIENDKGDSYYNNVLDNYLKYISNLERNPKNDPRVVAEIKRRWRREMVKHPRWFMMSFSDNPAFLEEAKREVAAMLYEMEHPS